MKYKDWLQQQKIPPIVPEVGAIYCPCCGRYIGNERDYMFLVLTYPVVCPDCDEIVIWPSNITFNPPYTTSNTQSITGTNIPLILKVKNEARN
jgi:hypothetical protein